MTAENYNDFTMKQTITIDFYFQQLEHLPVIDVRSPGEFAKGHLPGAHNIALFSDEERAVVGTAYKQESKERAIELGYEFVTPKLNGFITQSLEVAPEKEVVVHCWRGGMRSNAFADHLIGNGFTTVYVIEKGYKAFRNYVLAFFEQPFNLKVLGGYTGSGKTELLHFLEKKGQQVIDLEGLANHRGSAFGGIDLPPQPTTEQFETQIFSKLRAFDINQPIWLEDESKMVGNVSIPQALYSRMVNSTLCFLNVPLARRTEHLVQTYAHLDPAKLADAIRRIGKRLGSDKVKIALEALEKKDYSKVVAIILFYYDKYYTKGLQKRPQTLIQEIEISTADHEETADILISLTGKKMEETIKMTSYSHGAGCGCKIAPKVLTTILKSSSVVAEDPRLLVGNDTRDDAAVYDMGNGTGIISTTDFFLPIVDDPFTFGRIAATNALSDVYAMGGKPLMAIAILGWPIDQLAPEVAAEVMEGGRKACAEAGIIIAGGHSIDNPEPVFGLAVTGSVVLTQLKRNDKAQTGNLLFLTKPLGVGILTTAQKKDLLEEAHKDIAANSMVILNDVGLELSEMEEVTALTDVTGFGLMGHLLEVCEGSHVSANINFSKVPVFKETERYLDQKCIPGGTIRNWDSYGEKLEIENERQRHILCDPQTSGGLLIAVKKEAAEKVADILRNRGLYAEPIGELVEQGVLPIYVGE